MEHGKLDISKSISSEKLCFNTLLIDLIFERLFPCLLVISLPVISLIACRANWMYNKPIVLPILCLIISISIAILLIYAMRKINSLIRISGLSRAQNSRLIKKIAKRNRWDILYTNQQMTLIHFPRIKSGIDSTMHMTILYDGFDILVNCTTLGLYAVPSPFHWFANKRIVNQLRTEFEKEISLNT